MSEAIEDFELELELPCHVCRELYDVTFLEPSDYIAMRPLTCTDCETKLEDEQHSEWHEDSDCVMCQRAAEALRMPEQRMLLESGEFAVELTWLAE